MTSEQINIMKVTDMAGKIGKTFSSFSLKKCLTPKPANSGAITISMTLTTIARKSILTTEPASSKVSPGVNKGHKSVDTVVSETD